MEGSLSRNDTTSGHEADRGRLIIKVQTKAVVEVEERGKCETDDEN